MRELCLGGLLVLVVGCVPNGPASTSSEGGANATASSAQRPKSPAAPVVARPTGSAAPSAPSPPLGSGFEDNFERAAPGTDWLMTGADWRINSGRLCVKGARNHGAWLNRTLPTNVRIEFDAMSESPDGDIKAEIFGDGTSAAAGISYNDATSYLTIFGGWKNTFHVLARLNEHASDRPEIRIAPGSDDERARPVSVGQVYHFKIERADGKTLVWWVGDMQMFKFVDPQPLSGPGHDHIGFNDWDVPVCFDNVKVVAL
ncbi:MAG TPA: hypothetical protein VK550_36350 [Polyangiaceae bacterium]|nr:hypothetical protein [Polyangiaceae bacterium]